MSGVPAIQAFRPHHWEVSGTFTSSLVVASGEGPDRQERRPTRLSPDPSRSEHLEQRSGSSTSACRCCHCASRHDRTEHVPKSQCR